MKIAFDIRPLSNPEKFRGVGVYTKNLLKKLQTPIFKKIEIFEFDDEDQIPQDTDLIHYPYFNPFLLTLPLKFKKPTVVTVHDMIPLLFPQHFPKGVKGWFKWQYQKLRLKQTNHIITDSQASAQDICQVAHIKKLKISSVYLAASDDFKPASRTEQARVKKKYQLPDKFVLYVGEFNWNKNVVGLTKACLDLEMPLLVAGGRAVDENYDHSHPENQPLSEFQHLAKDNAELTTTPGYVSQKDLIALYSTAAVYCQPSFYEGFGLPILEAMACGCPVVCSNKGSLPEVAGKAVFYIKDPYSLTSIEKTLKKALNLSKNQRQKMIDQGLRQAERFSWQKTAQKTVEVYEKVIQKY